MRIQGVHIRTLEVIRCKDHWLNIARLLSCVPNTDGILQKYYEHRECSMCEIPGPVYKEARRKFEQQLLSRVHTIPERTSEGTTDGGVLVFLGTSPDVELKRGFSIVKNGYFI